MKKEHIEIAIHVDAVAFVIKYDLNIKQFGQALEEVREKIKESLVKYTLTKDEYPNRIMGYESIGGFTFNWYWDCWKHGGYNGNELVVIDRISIDGSSDEEEAIEILNTMIR